MTAFDPLSRREVVDAIERTVKLVMTDLYEPRIAEQVERTTQQKMHDHIRYILNNEGLLFPVRRVWRWRTWELSLGRRRR